jgi:predicted amidohydrolase
MTRQITIAAVQIPASVGGRLNAEKQDNNFRAAEHWLDQAGQRGADIACVGETFNMLGLRPTPDTLPAEIANAVDRAVTRLGDIARRYRMAVIAPVAGLLDGIPRNAALVLDRSGNLIGHYLKVHCTESERSYGIVPGNTWPTFTLDFGRIGLQICHDNSFPESARCLALNGAEIIFWPHTMSGWGDEFMETLMRSPSVHNGIYHVPACYGCEPGQAWRPGMLIGRSSIIGPDGVVLADAGRYVGIALSQIDLDAPRIAHDFTREGEFTWRDDMRQDRRPETYTVITQETTVLANLAKDKQDDKQAEKP